MFLTYLAGGLALVLAVTWFVVRRRQAPTTKAVVTTADGATRKENIRLPYRFDYGDLFVWKNSVWTGVRLGAVNDEHLPQERLDAMAWTATQAVGSLARDGAPVQVQVRVTHRPFDAEEWAAALLQKAWNPTTMYRRYVERLATYLSLVKMPSPVTFMFVQIDTLDTSAAEELLAAANAAMMGDSDEVALPDEVAIWQAKAEAVLRKLANLGARPATREERMWIIRKTLSGHLTPTVDDFPLRKAWGPGEFLLWIDFHAVNRRSHIEIHSAPELVASTDRVGNDGQIGSYTACLAVADWPEQVNSATTPPWLRWFARRPELPEITVRMNVTPPRSYLEKLTKASRNLNDERDDLAASRQQDLVVEQHALEAEDVVNELRTGRSPGIESQIIVQVSSPTERGLEDAVANLAQAAQLELGDSVRLVRPRKLQYRLLQATLPGADIPLPFLPYVRTSDMSMFGIGIPQGGTRVGDRQSNDRNRELGWIGDFIGNVGFTPVFYSPHSMGPARNKGGGAAILGASGGGKSNLGMLIVFQASESGVNCRVIDPKVDFAQFCLYLSFGNQVNDPRFWAEFEQGKLAGPTSRFAPTNPEFWDNTEIIDIIKARPGVFDAWQIERDNPSAAQVLALAQFEMFLTERDWGIHQDSIRSALGAATDAFEERIKTRAAELARKDPAADQVAVRAQAIRDVTSPTMWEVSDRAEREAQRVLDLIGDDDVSNLNTRTQMSALVFHMKSLREMPYSSLVFAQHPAGVLIEQEKRRTIFTMRGMDIPGKGSAPANLQQRFAVAIMYLITRINSQGLAQKPVPKPGSPGEYAFPRKLLFVDESNMVTAIPAGAQMLKENLGKGRSYGLVTFLADQQAARIADIEEGDGGSTDEDKGTGNQIHAVFAFMQKTMREAKAMLPLLGRTKDDPLAYRLLPEHDGGDLSVGVCIMRDADSNVGVLEVDLVFDELFRAADTNPETRADSHSFSPSPDPNDWEFIAATQARNHTDAAQVRFDEINAPTEEDDQYEADDGDGDGWEQYPNGEADAPERQEVSA